jgi:peptidoglycan hydrolase-like protein with peptidoglycan-binding domain
LACAEVSTDPGSQLSESDQLCEPHSPGAAEPESVLPAAGVGLVGVTRTRRQSHVALNVCLGLLLVATSVVAVLVGLAPRLSPAEAMSRHLAPLKPAPFKVLGTTPASGATDLGLSYDTISVQFSAPLESAAADPTLSPAVAGRWVQEGPTTLSFDPSGYLTPGSRVVLTVAAGPTGPQSRRGQSLSSAYTATFGVPTPSVLRLQELLAELGYLPLSFDPSPVSWAHQLLGGAQSATSAGTEPDSGDLVALAALPGSFSWRYPNVPASLAALWQPGVDTSLTQGAVMAFESDHGLDFNDGMTQAFWAELVKAAASQEITTAPYDYLEVSTALPETLSVWRDGKIIYSSLANTGIPEAPTAPGSYPVYARYVSTTMSGFNPDGSYYDDPDVPFVAYFNGGDAVHGFPRYSYGFPQSLGCVELPYSSAPVVFNLDPIGTIVTVS